MRECSILRAHPLLPIVAYERTDKYSVTQFEMHNPYRPLRLAEERRLESIQILILVTAFVYSESLEDESF